MVTLAELEEGERSGIASTDDRDQGFQSIQRPHPQARKEVICMAPGCDRVCRRRGAWLCATCSDMVPPETWMALRDHYAMYSKPAMWIPLREPEPEEKEPNEWFGFYEFENDDLRGIIGASWFWLQDLAAKQAAEERNSRWRDEWRIGGKDYLLKSERNILAEIKDYCRRGTKGCPAYRFSGHPMRYVERLIIRGALRVEVEDGNGYKVKYLLIVPHPDPELDQDVPAEA